MSDSRGPASLIHYKRHSRSFQLELYPDKIFLAVQHCPGGVLWRGDCSKAEMDELWQYYLANGALRIEEGVQQITWSSKRRKKENNAYKAHHRGLPGRALGLPLHHLPSRYTLSSQETLQEAFLRAMSSRR
jgi:hypothetical protein